jgi:hypothetical protein
MDARTVNNLPPAAALPRSCGDRFAAARRQLSANLRKVAPLCHLQTSINTSNATEGDAWAVLQFFSAGVPKARHPRREVRGRHRPAHRQVLPLVAYRRHNLAAWAAKPMKSGATICGWGILCTGSGALTPRVIRAAPE